MGLTDKALEILLGAVLILVLFFFAEQEISLRHAASSVAAQLELERGCRDGSECAQKLNDAASRGDAMATQARADAAAEVAAKKAALDKQAADAIQGLEAAQQAADKEAVNWKKRYQDLLAAPDCEAWSRQAVSCAVR